MPDQHYTLKTVDRAFELLRIVSDAAAPLSLSEIAARAETSTSNAFRFLKTLEHSGHLVRDDSKRYAAVRGGGGEIGLIRGIEMLDLIAATPEGGMTASALAAALSVDVPQVERALIRLQGAAVADFDSEAGLWRLSTGMMRFFRPLLNDQFLARFIRPIMQELNEAYEETVSWFVPHGWDQVVVEVIPSPHPLRYVLDTAARQPIYLGAAGKAHLAALDQDAVAEFLAQLEPVQLTGYRLDKTALIAELQQIRRRGFAVSDGERVEGAVSAAVAVHGPGGQVKGVLSVMMPKFRKSPDDVREIAETLKARVGALFETGAESAP